MENTQHFFDHMFSNARVNAMLILDKEGIIERLNAAFTLAYGYQPEDLEGKHFRILFIEKDRLTRRPEIELNTTHREGSSTDENYLLHKNGKPIWVSGESILVKRDDSTRIVKVIHNIHAQKQLERYLLKTSELLDSLFDSVQQSCLLMLDSRLKIVKVNDQFKTMFGITDAVAEGLKLQQIPHPFWSGEELKNDLMDVTINNATLDKEYIMDKGDRNFSRIRIASKTITADDGADKKILLMIKEA